MEFRPRDYNAEAKLHELPREPAENHPLSALHPPRIQASVADHQSSEFYDPLRASDNTAEVSNVNSEEVESALTAELPGEAAVLLSAKEWSSLTRFLMQRFPVSKTVSLSPISSAIMNGGKTFEKSSTSMHSEELEDHDKVIEEGIKVLTRHEYVSRLHELKGEISHAWNANDRVTALKLSIKVARLLADTSVLQFYPTLFVLATDIMDMLGDIVWERIKHKAEFAEDGTRLCSLPENFEVSGICLDAKETCNNWFCKIGAIQELLPRIYLELAILPCWRFLHDQPGDCLKRLIMMVRGIADPLTSAYCRLYLARCAQKLPTYDMGLLVTCVSDIKTQLMQFISAKEHNSGKFMDNKLMCVGLMEPTIEYLVKCIFKDNAEGQLNNTLIELGLGKNKGSSRYISIVLHNLLKELPSEAVCSYAVRFLQLIECSNDFTFSQSSNYKLLGLRLCERRVQMDIVNTVLDSVIQVVTQYESIDEYLKVVDAYVDIVLQNQMDNHLESFLEGIPPRARDNRISEDGLLNLQSILVKLLFHYQHLEDVFAVKHFLEILELLYGTSRSFVSMNILNMATRDGCVHDPTTIQLLFEISQALHDAIDYVNIKDDDNQAARLISRFIQMVDFGAEMERHLTFLVECRGAFGGINELKETLVHLSNCLAIKAMKDSKKHGSFVKSCIVFSEVTLPSISAQIKQLNLYLETAEVALLGGLICHTDGLIDSAISCLQSLEIKDGSRSPAETDIILSSTQKLCSLLVSVPGNPEKGIAYFPRSILSFVSSQSWMTPKMRTRILCALLSLLATQSQIKFPYPAGPPEFLRNDELFFGDSSYVHELVSLSELILQNLVDAIQKEPSQAARGSMALEACNCVASSFMLNREALAVCSNLIETAKSGLSATNKHLLSTIRFLEKRNSSPAIPKVGSPITI